MREWMEMLRDEKKATVDTALLAKPLQVSKRQVTLLKKKLPAPNQNFIPQIISVGTHYSCSPPTLVILILSALQVLYFRAFEMVEICQNEKSS